MSTTYITPAEIIQVKNQNPDSCIFELDAKNTRKNSNSDYPTYYVPFMVKRLSGKSTPFNLKIQKQVLSSNAKISKQTNESKANHVLVVFSTITGEDLTNTDYDAKLYDVLVKANNELVDAFKIVAADYMDMVENQVINKNKGKYRIAEAKIREFGQTSRKASDEEMAEDAKLPEDDQVVMANGRILLEKPLFRIKIPANVKNNQKLGRPSYDKASGSSSHIYNVFDARKARRGKVNKTTPAAIKRNGKLIDLDVRNAHLFVTYRSLVSGTISFDSVCLSGSGVSLMSRFRDLHVWPHRKMAMEMINDEDMNEFAMLGTSGYDDNVDDPDDDDDFTESKVESKTVVIRRTTTRAEDDEPDNNDEEPPETKSSSRRVTTSRSVDPDPDTDLDDELNDEDLADDPEPELEPESPPNRRIAKSVKSAKGAKGTKPTKKATTRRPRR